MDGAINPANDFLYNLRQVVKQPSRCIFVTTYPDDVAFSEHCSECMRKAFEDEGFEFERYTLLDSRTARHARQLVHDSDFIILGGGHVPSQNRFLRSMGFAKLLKGYKGVVLGISAGSMNSARVVYALPEEAMMQAYRACSATIGQRVQVIAPAGSFTGTALAVTDSGSLIVEDEEGQRREVLAADVSVRGLMGYA